MILRELPKQLKIKNVYYTQVKRKQGVAMYSLRYSPETRIVGHDVVRVTQSTLGSLEASFAARGIVKTKIEGNPEDICESYPPSTVWGSKAWSFNSVETASKKFDELTLAGT